MLPIISLIFRVLLNLFSGLLPTLFWLFHYLKRDIKPEPKRMILRVFLWGCLITLPVLFVQMGLSKILNFLSLKLGFLELDVLLELSLPQLNYLSLIIVLLHWFLIISFTEEIFKYAVVRAKVYNNSHHLDEPVDIMIYMIVAALGFAALENIFYLSQFALIEDLPASQILGNTVILSSFRFISAIFLHTLTSGIFGYFLALSFFESKKGRVLFLKGLIIAALLHGFYNFSIILIKDPILKTVVVITLLSATALFLSAAFRKIKTLKSICKI